MGTSSCRRGHRTTQTSIQQYSSPYSQVVYCMSYLRSWFSLDTASSTSNSSAGSSHSQQSLSVPGSFTVEDDDDGSDTAGEDDVPPAFPAINSAQRAVASHFSSSHSSMESSIPKILTDSALMPPPPIPSLATRQLGVPPPKSSSSLLSPMGTTQPPRKPSKREKVALAPGFGPLDWGNLKSSGQNLRVSILTHPLGWVVLRSCRGLMNYSEFHHLRSSCTTRKRMLGLRSMGRCIILLPTSHITQAVRRN